MRFLQTQGHADEFETTFKSLGGTIWHHAAADGASRPPATGRSTMCSHAWLKREIQKKVALRISVMKGSPVPPTLSKSQRIWKPMRRLSLFTGLIMASLTIIVTLPTHAAPVLFDFENQPIFTETPFSMSNGGVTASFAGPAGVDPGAFGISSNFLTPTGFQYRLMQGDFLTIGSAFGASGSALTITFSAPLTSFSLAFGLDDPANTSTLSFTTNGGDAGSVGGALSGGFRYPEGILSFNGAAFTTLTLRSNAIDFQIDDLRGASVSTVPEPASLLLLATGLPLIGLARRRNGNGNTKCATPRDTNA